MAQGSVPYGFLNLPLEICQQIYDSFETELIVSPRNYEDPKGLFALSRTNKQLRDEIHLHFAKKRKLIFEMPNADFRLLRNFLGDLGSSRATREEIRKQLLVRTSGRNFQYTAAQTTMSKTQKENVRFRYKRSIVRKSRHFMQALSLLDFNCGLIMFEPSPNSTRPISFLHSLIAQYCSEDWVPKKMYDVEVSEQTGWPMPVPCQIEDKSHDPSYTGNSPPYKTYHVILSPLEEEQDKVEEASDMDTSEDEIDNRSDISMDISEGKVVEDMQATTSCSTLPPLSRPTDKETYILHDRAGNAHFL